MNENQIYPDNFPDEFKQDVFTLGTEAAWPTGRAIQVVDWLRKNGFAVLGTELWLIREDGVQPGIFVNGIAEIHGNDESRMPNEPWDVYVSRSGMEALRYLSSFTEPPEASQQGKVVFNIVWANESDFLKLRART